MVHRRPRCRSGAGRQVRPRLRHAGHRRHVMTRLAARHVHSGHRRRSRLGLHAGHGTMVHLFHRARLRRRGRHRHRAMIHSGHGGSCRCGRHPGHSGHVAHRLITGLRGRLARGRRRFLGRRPFRRNRLFRWSLLRCRRLFGRRFLRRHRHRHAGHALHRLALRGCGNDNGEGGGGREGGGEPGHAASPFGRTLTTRIMPACMW